MEAGFDRGYLKKSRRAHLSLIAKIEAYRKESESSDSSAKAQLRRASRKVDEVVNSLELSKQQLYNVISQNLQLVERVRELEKEIQRLLSSKAPRC